MIASAEGGLGPNFDYLASLVRHRDELGIDDDAIRQLHTRAKAYRSRLE
ncbi:hypothetical protein [Lutimaribacter saemankumensis]|nr:hypothetical protein [Lutimaribacter saemankumensis]